ncbi:uncharacterized protein CBL_08110 [Carabus blaptoides fortunei]
MLSQITKQPNEIIAATYLHTKGVQCINTDLTIKEWSVKYESVKNDTCDAITSKHALLIETQFLRKCADPFMLPFPEALYIQTTAQRLKVRCLKEHFLHHGKPIHRSHHAQWKQKILENARRKQMYEKLSIKKVIRETGTVECGFDAIILVSGTLDAAMLFVKST